jgi:hypothetical protein
VSPRTPYAVKTPRSVLQNRPDRAGYEGQFGIPELRR